MSVSGCKDNANQYQFKKTKKGRLTHIAAFQIRNICKSANSIFINSILKKLFYFAMHENENVGNWDNEVFS